MITADPVSRFRAKIVTSEAGCHVWQSTVKRDGYGQFWLHGKPRKAHQVAYELFVGPVPEGMHVLHKCDNRVCVNPEHLYAGTPKQNMQDRTARLRYACRKLSGDAVRMIRELYSSGDFTQTALAARFGCGQTHISKVVRRQQRILK